jgi:hypothetical protein
VGWRAWAAVVKLFPYAHSGNLVSRASISEGGFRASLKREANRFSDENLERGSLL